VARIRHVETTSPFCRNEDPDRSPIKICVADLGIGWRARAFLPLRNDAQGGILFLPDYFPSDDRYDSKGEPSVYKSHRFPGCYPTQLPILKHVFAYIHTNHNR
jgi:hypothetical protein